MAEIKQTVASSFRNKQDFVQKGQAMSSINAKKGNQPSGCRVGVGVGVVVEMGGSKIT